MLDLPSISTDQVSAFVTLAQTGSLRAAAKQMHISEQGVRNRLLALEDRLGVDLYRKSRGVRRASVLTSEGQGFLPYATSFLERARELCDLFGDGKTIKEVHVVASHYLISYVLIHAVSDFHKANPNIRVRLQTCTEAGVESSLMADPMIAMGVAAPFESPSDLEYEHLFSMNWSIITSERHHLARRKSIRLTEISGEPMAIYERGSAGRQHIIDAFRERGLTARIEMEATTTDVIVRMVEAGLGIAIVPLLPSGEVTKGHRVRSIPLGKQIRPIQSGLITRRGQQSSTPAEAFANFIRSRRP